MSESGKIKRKELRQASKKERVASIMRDRCEERRRSLRAVRRFVDHVRSSDSWTVTV
jgi:hypothetical protein